MPHEAIPTCDMAALPTAYPGYEAAFNTDEDPWAVQFLPVLMGYEVVVRVRVPDYYEREDEYYYAVPRIVARVLSAFYASRPLPGVTTDCLAAMLENPDVYAGVEVILTMDAGDPPWPSLGTSEAVVAYLEQQLTDVS